MAWVLFCLLITAATISIAVDLYDESSEQITLEPPTNEIPLSQAATTEQHSDSPRSFTIAATGELLIHESIADTARTADGWDFTPMFTNIAPILRQADLAVCHLETPLSPNNTNLSYFPAFLVPNDLAEAIAYAGYDTCSLASNHSTDAGREGIIGTITALDRVAVAHAGMALSAESRNRVTLIAAGNARVAHLSYTYGFNNGPLDNDETYLSNVINEAIIIEEARRARSAGADFVILSLHWGPNYRIEPDEMQVDLGPRLLESPEIDLIIGNHAHVIQPLVEINGEYLAYGLGNFLSNQSPDSCTTCPPATQDGVILHFTVTESADGNWTVSDVTYTPTWVDRSNFEIVDVLSDTVRDPELLEASATRTATAIRLGNTTISTR